MVWSDATPGNQEIYYKSSSNGGASWTPLRRLSNTVGASLTPVVAVSGANVHVAWSDTTSGNEEIYYKSSSNGGVNWTGVRRLTWTSGVSKRPALAFGGSTLHLVWDDSTPGNKEIYYKSSGNGGANWSAIRRLSTTNGNSYAAAIAVERFEYPRGVERFDPGNFEIYTKSSNSGGGSWSSLRRLSTTSGASMTPAIVVNGSDVQLSWADSTTGNFEIQYKSSQQRWRQLDVADSRRFDQRKLLAAGYGG